MSHPRPEPRAAAPSMTPDRDASPAAAVGGTVPPAAAVSGTDLPALPPLTRFSSNPDDVVGRVLDNRYAVEAVLGQGAMAVVLGARHLFLDQPVALKILHPALSAVPEMRERFLREARVTSGVEHDGLVRVSDFGVTAEGLYYLVMEQLEGEDLLTWSERRGQASAEECARFAISICETLAALHAHGYVHRDIKPENLWVVPEEGGLGRIKVLDLGIAGLIESAAEERIGRRERRGARDASPRLTSAGQTLGTALYMSPEQAIGNALDQRSDLYALGCVLWELATDRTTFEGPNANDIMLKHISEVPPPPSSLNPELPAWFDALVMKLLEKHPDDRFQSAEDTGKAFAAALAAHPAVPTPAPPSPLMTGKSPTAQRPVVAEVAPRRWPYALALALAAVVALIVGLVLGNSSTVAVIANESVLGVAPPFGPEEGPGATGVGTATTDRHRRDFAPPPLPDAVSAPSDVGPTPAGAPAATAPPATTPPPEMISVAFAVDPRGAVITRDGQRVGVSPIVLDVPRGAPAATYVLSAEGRVAKSLRLAHDADVIVQETLARAPRPTSGGTIPSGPTGPSGPSGPTGPTGPRTNEDVGPSRAPSQDGLWQPARPDKGPDVKDMTP